MSVKKRLHLVELPPHFEKFAHHILPAIGGGIVRRSVQFSQRSARQRSPVLTGEYQQSHEVDGPPALRAPTANLDETLLRAPGAVGSTSEYAEALELPKSASKQAPKGVYRQVFKTLQRRLPRFADDAILAVLRRF